MASMDDIKQTFFEECQELLEDMEAGLIALNDGDTDPERVNAVFRAAHSIKGGAGAFGFDALVAFAHRFETTLDEVRSGRLETNTQVMGVFLRAADVLSDLVAAAQDDLDPPTSDQVLAELAALTGDDLDAPEEEPAGPSFTPMGLDFGNLDIEAPADPIGYRIHFAPTPDLYRRGNEPALLLQALRSLGKVVCTAQIDDIEDLDDEPDAHPLSWVVELTTQEPRDSVAEIFEFVEDDCTLEIEDLLPDDGEEAVSLPLSLPVTAPASPSPETDSAPTENTSSTPDAPAEAAPKPKAKSDDDATAKAAPAKSGTDTPARGGGSIRVDLDRVDRLINLVGELVVNQAMLSQSVVDAGMTTSSPVATGLDEFKNLTREVQDSVMAIRAQPVRSLFQRMSRIIREGAAATKKNVKLVTEGETTEIDKTVIELLADPLTHMIRNAIDHGLETPADRAEAGKDPQGTVRLSAAHRSGRVVIEIADDGAGINRERVQAIATEKGLIAPDAQLSPNEIDNLLFLPGFSTAKEVSALSGRGVGMDVVKQAISKLGGRISITSQPGRGSTFTISLPLTLAVLDGMVVKVDGQTLVVPLNAIVETIRPDPSQLHKLGHSDQVIHVRDCYVPVIDLGQALGFTRTIDSDSREVLLLIEGDQTGQCALALDMIVEQRQVVIKSLEDNYGHVDGVAAATILGNGRIALIIDPDAVIAPYTQTEAQALGGAA